MADTTRTFLAIPLPDEIRASLQRLREELEPISHDLRWVDPALYHLTLAFLGDVENSRLDSIASAASEAALEFGPLPLRLEGVGAFPNPSKLRVLWAGLGGSGIGDLKALQKALVQALDRVGQRPDDDRFHPHITLARSRYRPRGGRTSRAGTPNLSRLIEQYQGWSGGSFEAKAIISFESILRPEGPQYQELARINLGNGKERAEP